MVKILREADQAPAAETKDAKTRRPRSSCTARLHRASMRW